MPQKITYFKVKFALGAISVIFGLLGACIALFRWVERTGFQSLFGEFAQYVCAFGGFIAMICGAMLVNDAWILRKILMGKYEEIFTHEKKHAKDSKHAKKRENIEPLEKKEKETPKADEID